MIEEIIEAVLQRMRKENILIKDMPDLLNEYLPFGEKIATGRSGAVQVSRWLALNKEYGVTPRGPVLLALMQFSNYKTNETKTRIVQPDK
jgi:hypothetical protein